MLHMERKTLRRGLYAALALALPVWTCIAGASCTATQPAAPPALGEEGGGGSSSGISASSSGSGSGGGQDATMPPMDASSDVAQCSEAGLTSCNGLCVDLLWDHDHCGSCTNGCSAMGPLTTCSQGKCVCEADAGAVLCGMAPGMCVDTLSDPNNCGTCGHICQTNSMGVCQGGYCTPIIVAQTSGPIFDIVVDMSYVWWTQPGASGQSGTGALLRKTFASGSTIETFTNGLNDPRGIAKDLANIYWVDYVDTSVDQVSQNQTPLGTHVVDWPPPPSDAGAPPPTYPNAMHVAVDANNIYWTTNARNGFVLSVPIASAGSVAPTVIASGQAYPYGITVAGGHVIWTNQGTSTTPPDGAIMSAPVGGGSVTTLASGEPNPWNIASDGTNVYWTDNDISGFVKQLPIGGGTPITLASNEGGPYGIAVDANNVYWTSQDDNTVNAISIGGGDGGGKRIYAVQQSGPTAITVNTKNIYWANSTAGTILEVTK
jgi:hypothetical protein